MLWRLTVHPKMMVPPSEVNTWNLDTVLDANELLDTLDAAEARLRER